MVQLRKKEVIDYDEYKLEYVYYDDGRMFVLRFIILI